MNVDDAAAPAPRDLRRHEFEVAGERDQLHAMRVQQPRERAPVRRVRDDGGGDVPFARPPERARVRAVARDEHDLGGARLAERVQMIDDRLQVASPARGENGQAHGWRGRPHPGSAMWTTSVSVCATSASRRARSISAGGVSSLGTSTPRAP